jgi:GTP-binding protein YchF
MPLKAGIVGLPNVGKSTLFNALTSAKALAANYPFATKDPNLGIITVPDDRLLRLADIVKPKMITPTTIEILDIAGLIKGASKGEGLGNQFLANIREVDAIVHVVRCFEDPNVVHVDGDVDPVRDKEIIDMELILKDIETTEKRIDRLKKQAKTGKKEDMLAVTHAEKVLEHLSKGNLARTFIGEEEEAHLIEEMYLLTAKPMLYVCNVDEASVISGNAHTQHFQELVKGEDAEVIFISAAIEAEIAQLESVDERLEYLATMGLSEPGVNKLIRSTYKLLELVTFFTAGEREVRAWTIHRGWKAPKAAGVIHSDFERGFIRAEVIKYVDYLHFGSEAHVKEAGKMAVEGKEYIVHEGDVIYFRFNV